MPPLEEVRKYLDYDPETGLFNWIQSPCNGIKEGQPAGCVSLSGYKVIRFNSFLYRANRLAWFWMTGNDPGNSLVDHKDRDRSNDKFSNLRLAQRSQNNTNRSGAGIRQKLSGKWAAAVRHSGKQHYLGCFDCPLLARLAYEEKKRELCGEYSPV